MKVIMAVQGFNEGKEFRHDLMLSSISLDEYKIYRQTQGSRFLYQSMAFKDMARFKAEPIPNFVNIFKHFSPETEDEMQYCIDINDDFKIK